MEPVYNYVINIIKSPYVSEKTKDMSRQSKKDYYIEAFEEFGATDVFPTQQVVLSGLVFDSFRLGFSFLPFHIHFSIAETQAEEGEYVIHMGTGGNPLSQKELEIFSNYLSDVYLYGETKGLDILKERIQVHQ